MIRMAPLFRKAPEETVGTKPNPDSECRMVVVEPYHRSSSMRMRSEDSEIGKGGWQWSNSSLAPSRKTALIYLAKDTARKETTVMKAGRRRSR